MKHYFEYALFVVLCLISCTNDSTEIDEEQVETSDMLFYKPNISAADFKSKIQGFAWRMVDGYEIDLQTGKMDAYSFYGGGYDEDGNLQMRKINGWKPIHHYFADNKQVIHFHDQVIYDNYYTEDSYVFNEKNSSIHLEEKGGEEEEVKKDYPWMYVVKIDADTLYVIQTFYFGDVRPHVYNKYVKMTPDELENTINTHKEKR